MPRTLTDEDVATVATAVVKALPDVWLMRSPICTAEEAMAYCRINSPRSWRDFCARTGLRRVSAGRYKRAEVEKAARYDTKARRA